MGGYRGLFEIRYSAAPGGVRPRPVLDRVSGRIMFTTTIKYFESSTDG